MEEEGAPVQAPEAFARQPQGLDFRSVAPLGACSSSPAVQVSRGEGATCPAAVSGVFEPRGVRGGEVVSAACSPGAGKLPSAPGALPLRSV